MADEESLIDTKDIPENKQLIVINTDKYKFDNLLLFFLIFSILGWIFETAYTSIQLGLTKRGFLLGPYCPIYGCGAIMLIIALSYIEKMEIKHKYLKLFFGAIIVFSAFEYTVGYGIEALFKIRCWDYTYDILNLNGRISIMYCFMWGLAAILFTKILYPLYQKGNKALNKMNYRSKHALVIVCCSVFIFDIILSCIKYLV